ncbi:hypothetical protein BGW36DRAFT_386812 [Talaromyces proteolyticus]|uniref:Uncharacterized protein n=1 Tax=Talaromyces proteolyticus TaxID=1131652 RepID=A0AAD4PWU0_9EURO|nr:uncharacterized protein BGW36DRAFT_386812 [Talaromyces proteolyticus]KAH8692009.1 hypothetical protein BGW36DRAFT_386812 [Talaromyces proteolyticus]
MCSIRPIHYQSLTQLMMLHSQAEYHRFIESQPATVIADYLRHDQQRCRNKELPSMLAMYLPSSSSSPLAMAIANNLSNIDVPLSLKELQYDSIVKSIRAYLHQLDHVQSGESNCEKKNLNTPTPNEFSTAIKVLDYLRKEEKHTTPKISDSTPLADVMRAIDTHLGIDPMFCASFDSISLQNTSRKCYICRHEFRRSESHHLYHALCRPCGHFNLTQSELAFPEKLNLEGKTALVTGGRVNLGFYTALRLLRCGAKVIVSTRYPHDAESRYSQQHDANKWTSRLRIVGADFRTARDAFQLVAALKSLLREWSKTALHILINNAAQTLTDPVKSELAAVRRETQLQNSFESRPSTLLSETQYKYEPRVRGGMQEIWKSSIEGNSKHQISQSPFKPEDQDGNEARLSKGLGGHDSETERSSWVQEMSDIPYEDIISAFSVNSFVPLILCRELLPVMGSRSGARKNKSNISRPEGYIINVSSREGILENRSPKTGHHVHTNMSKAAINMITETEAENAWARQVAMNTVDPGYMSAAPEFERDEGCPIGFEDGTSRVLWPIAVGEMRESVIIRGRFLKHFGAVGASIQRG